MKVFEVFITRETTETVTRRVTCEDPEDTFAAEEKVRNQAVDWSRANSSTTKPRVTAYLVERKP